jgi:hypothetical protein
MALILSGTVVTFDVDQPELDPGVVYLGEDGIEAVTPPDAPAPAGFQCERRFCFSSRGCQAPPWRLVRSAILGPSAESGATDRRPRPAWPPRR